MTSAALDRSMDKTPHGMLVAFGEFLRQYGLVEKMMQVPIRQKTRTFKSQSKLVKFMAGWGHEWR